MNAAGLFAEADLIIGCQSATAELLSSTFEAEGNRVGSELIGPYRVEAVLGEGGMGEVFLARDEKLQRQVAIKRIRRGLPADALQRARFRREALAVARLNHPAIVQVFDLLETESGDCLVMERVEGRPLSELIAAGELDLRLILRLGGEIAEGLAEAHSKGLIHRDLKAENVLVTVAGHAKIVDFGLALFLWSEEDGRPDSQSGLTQAGMLVGTLHAMSPEQAGGGQVDHRSDLFSLGGLLYEMLAGRPPFRGDNWLDTLRRINAEPPPPLAVLRPGLPPALVELVEQLLRKNKEERPANARLVAASLEAVARGAGEPVAQRPAGALGSGGSAGSSAEAATGDWPGPAAADSRGQTALRTLLWVARSESRGKGAHPDPALSLEAAGRELRRLRDLLAQHGGVEVEKGEALLAVFERPADALACALDYQRALAELSASLQLPLKARAGLHLGELLLVRPGRAEVGRGARPLEVEGAAKDLVKRLGSLARGGQVLLTQGAFDLARRAGGHALSGSGTRRDEEDEPGEEGALRWLAHGTYLVDGVEGPLEVFEVGREGFAPLEPPADSRFARRLLSPSEERMLGWRPAAGQPLPQRPLWTLVERLGEGGFGEVWLARHKAGERRVFKFCFEAERLRALKREVTLFRLLKEALGHRDDIARILDWQFEEPPYFVESEYTEGGNLARWAEQQGGLGTLPPATRLALAAEVAEALAAAHSVGILHKDVKPENVLVAIDREGRPRPRLTDFGVGQVTERERLAAGGVTALGFTDTLGEDARGAGTVGYLAPELLEGKPPSIQADIYSWGVLLYQLVVGDFKHALAPGWERGVGDELLVEDLARFVDGSPERRPASAREAAAMLRSLETRRAARAAAEKNRLAQARFARRRRFATVAAAISSAVLVVVAVMGWREFRARQAAEAAEQRASLRQRQAEDLIGFMLGDLRKKLEGVGRLEVLDAVGEQAMAYFAAVPAAELSDEELARRSKALYQLGEVRVNQGQLGTAREAFEEASRLAAALVAREPDNQQWTFELAQSVFWLGNVDWSRRDAEAALGHFRRYLAIAERQLERDGQSRKWQLEVAYATSSLAVVHQGIGELEHAEAQLRRSIAIKERLLALEPGNLEWRTSLANGLAWLASLHRSRGRLRDALGGFSAELALREELLRASGGGAAARSFLVASLSNFGELLLDGGELETAAAAFGRELETAESLAGEDPANRNWQRDLAVANRHRAEVLALEGRLERATFHLERAEKILAFLVGSDPSNEAWRQQLAETLILAAELSLETGRPKGAGAAAHRALELLDSGVEAGPRVAGQAGRAHLVSGRALARQGRTAAARQAWEQARAALEPWRHQSAPLGLKAGWAQAMHHLGRGPEAAAALEELRQAGYSRPSVLGPAAANSGNDEGRGS
jgi:serine/threonine protein kinase/tetratricopeptide (TPR) repeat protein